jgi:hypothetical protein
MTIIIICVCQFKNIISSCLPKSLTLWCVLGDECILIVRFLLFCINNRMSDFCSGCLAVLALSSLFPAVEARGAASAVSMALTAAAAASTAMMIESVAAGVAATVASAAAVTLLSHAAAMLMRGQQSAANCEPVGDNYSAAIAMQ